MNLLSRMAPSRVRMRLTLLYGLLFVSSGAGLLVVTYVLVSRRTGEFVLIKGRTGSPPPGVDDLDFSSMEASAEQARAESAARRAEQLHELMIQGSIALAIMAVISILLGWWMAGRVLRPLRTMTTSIQRISARNVHERLAVEGPKDELKDLADTVDGLLGRLESALDSHKRFVANAAHELRTPLTLEHALLEETLIDRDATLESFRATFDRLMSLSEQQARLLESLLTLASSERGLDRRESLDLALVTEQVLQAARPACVDLKIESALASAPAIGDPALVERLVANLVDNAVCYNVPDGRIEVTTGIRGGQAVVRVVNTGPPVPPEQVERLFEPFQRLERTGSDGAHHGLGLSIVRAIAAVHDATVSARALPEGGLFIEAAFPAGHPA